ncbi:universal stress protein [Oceanicola sp. 22II-s10i]|uniref:universal stress protein n=1 Tax=Oceanicola sp. 22II-s10i TaxID=1317116 RepID=UPI000B525DAB|nr:universal stress protein [Oceanicola sp. 22II-s10i]OWU86458.1 universal stress protein [Oceanicola sp. 22II-s10i]
MSFQTILSVVTDKATVKDSLAPALAVAEAYGAHLDALCLGIDRTNIGYYYEGASAVALQDAIDRARAEAGEIEAATSAALDASGLRYGTDAEVAQMGDLGRHVAERARFADLVVLPLPYGEGKGPELEPVLEAALFEGQSPILVVPDTAKLVPKPQKIMLAWNESAEALRAIRKSLPLLRHAKTVHIVVIDPPVHGRNRSDPGGMLAQYLARHGVHAEIDVLSKTMPKVSDILKRHAVDIDADMVVMGAYGHSRFREAILGGATRNMLEEAPVPVFMAH